MKLLLLCLGSFVLGVFVGGRMWMALIFCAALVAVWWFGIPRLPPDCSARPTKPFGRGSRNRGY